MKRSNTIGITGHITTEPGLVVDAADWRNRIYEAELMRLRADGRKETFILRFDAHAAGSEEMFRQIIKGTEVLVGGELRSENLRDPEPGEGKTRIYIFAEVITVNDPPADSQNEVCLRGHICRTPVFPINSRVPGGKGRAAVARIMIAVSTQQSAAYIPCVCFGKQAWRVKDMKQGDCVELYGRFASRRFERRIPGKELPFLCVVNEVHVTRMAEDSEERKGGKTG